MYMNAFRKLSCIKDLLSIFLFFLFVNKVSFMKIFDIRSQVYEVESISIVRLTFSFGMQVLSERCCGPGSSIRLKLVHHCRHVQVGEAILLNLFIIIHVTYIKDVLLRLPCLG